MKRKIIILLLLILPFVLKGQTISTISGNGVNSDAGDGGSALSAEISWPFALAVDTHNNVYITETLANRIRKISSSGDIVTIAGTGTAGYNGDSIAATAAQLNQPYGIAVDSHDNLFIADTYNNRIRKINTSTGLIFTIAGNGSAGYYGENEMATSSILNGPYDICFDAPGNLFVADFSNYRIRKINTFSIISTVAGNGNPVDSGDGNSATSAAIWSMMGISTDNIGNLYIADRTGGRIRKVSVSGIITTIAGNGGYYATGDGGQATNASLNPERLAFDKLGNLYVADGYKANIRRIDVDGIIHAVTTDTIPGYNGDGGSALSAQFQYPSGIAFDTCGNLFIADDVNARIRKIIFNPACWPQGTPQLHTSTMNVYPNPTYGELNIDDVQSATAYSLLSITGAVRQRGELQRGSNTIPMQNLAVGMYLLELMNSENEKTVMKIVKE